MSWNQYQATQTSITGDTTNRLDYTPCRGLVHFTHVTWPAQLVPSLSFWVMIGRSPRRDCSGSRTPIPTRTGPTYQNSTFLDTRVRTRKLPNKEANQFLSMPGCLSAINHQKL